MTTLTQPIGWTALLPSDSPPDSFAAFLDLDQTPEARRAARSFRSMLTAANVLWTGKFSAPNGAEEVPLTASGMYAVDRTTAETPAAVMTWLINSRTPATDVASDVALAEAADIGPEQAGTPATSQVSEETIRAHLSEAWLCGLPAVSIARIRDNRLNLNDVTLSDVALGDVDPAAADGAAADHAETETLPADDAAPDGPRLDHSTSGLQINDGWLEWQDLQVLYVALVDGFAHWAEFITPRADLAEEFRGLFDLTAAELRVDRSA